MDAAAAGRRLQQSLPYRKRVPEAFSIINAINSLLQSLNPQNPKIYINPNPTALSKFSAYLTEDLVIQVIKNSKSPYHSLFFFNWASNPIPNPIYYRHSRICYTAIAEKLLPHQIFLSPEDLLKYGSKNTDFPASKLIKAYGDLKHLNWCVNLFRRERRNDGLCLSSFNSLLDVLVKDKKVEYAWGYFGNIVIKSSVLIPDVCTYTTMIGGLCKVGMVDYAEKLFDEMPVKVLVTYNTLIDGLCKNGLVEIAQNIVDRMGGDDGCNPSVVTFNALIDGYCKKGQIDYAFKCFDEMVRKVRCEPNAVMYNTLINGLCLNGRVEEAKRMLSRMRRAGLREDVSTHTSFLNGYCIAERYYETIVHFNEMIALDVSIIPRLDNCNIVLKSLIKLRQLDKAIEFLNEIPLWGFRPNFTSYKVVILGLVAEGRMQDIDTILNDMIQDRWYPDFELYNSLIEVYCVNGNVDKAIHLFKEMLGDGYVLKRECFEVFFKELCSRGFVNLVECLLDHMRKCCPGFDVVTYQRVLNEYVTARDESSSTTSSVLVEDKTEL